MTPPQLIMAALIIASTAYQMHQQRKAQVAAKKKAAKAANARKGFEIVYEGEIQSLALVYGRNRIGGTRVFHKIKSDTVAVTGNYDRQFIAGDIYETRTGKRNEFLYFQQVICKRAIHAVHDIILDDSKRLNDYILWKETDEDGMPKGRARLRVDIHYGNVEKACNFMTANCPERFNAKFPGCAFASVGISLNRNAPQFSGVPDLNFFIEGVLVPDIINGVLITTPSYSTNPARCLLDYLLNERKVDVSHIDLPSFENAKNICDIIVMEDSLCGGAIWRPVDESRNIERRKLQGDERKVLALVDLFSKIYSTNTYTSINNNTNTK
jgi:hypothetical protein